MKIIVSDFHVWELVAGLPMPTLSIAGFNHFKYITATVPQTDADFNYFEYLNLPKGGRSKCAETHKRA